MLKTIAQALFWVVALIAMVHFITWLAQRSPLAAAGVASAALGPYRYATLGRVRLA